MDRRWNRLGELLVSYSLEIKPGENVMIAMVEIETYPLAYAVYEACIKAGAFPQVQFLSEELVRTLLIYGGPEQITREPGIEGYGMEWADVYLGLRGAHNPNVLWDIPADRLSMFRRTMGRVSTARWEKTRWCLVRVPNSSLAQEAGIDEQTLLDMFFDGCFLDWDRLNPEWNRIADILNDGKKIQIIGNETDLSFSVEGRTWGVASGKTNMPDGEIMTSPDVSTIDGRIYFEMPGVLAGRLIHDIRLCWRKGELVEAVSSTNQDFLEEIIGTDDGSSLIGEFAFGTNPVLKHFSNDILLDEKIGGTIHTALGRAYPESGGTNQSAIHWDIVKDMRKEGQVFLDDELIFERGKFVV